MLRWTVSPTARVEILDRLLEENHRRAALPGRGRGRPGGGRVTASMRFDDAERSTAGGCGRRPA
ncbi:MAG: hypothetical protein L0H64_04475 [Pseudonocardia sp.]|nr:hypothetical protein [Pseudonocardia sp.]